MAPVSGSFQVASLHPCLSLSARVSAVFLPEASVFSPVRWG